MSSRVDCALLETTWWTTSRCSGVIISQREARLSCSGSTDSATWETVGCIARAGASGHWKCNSPSTKGWASGDGKVNETSTPLPGNGVTPGPDKSRLFLVKMPEETLTHDAP